jgi:DNA (cytosine-5)-methyltransferase 1
VLDLPRDELGAWSGEWGGYAPVIGRWESVIGRAAPPPLVPGARSPWALSPAFSEWVMGLPRGHVTGVGGLGRRVLFEMLGNGVVPAQAAAALPLLFAALSHVDGAA